MINYKLAKQLRDAGFPQPAYWENKYAYCDCEECVRGGKYEPILHLIHEDNDEGGLVGIGYTHRFEEVKNWIYCPTLSELVEACGEEFKGIDVVQDKRYKKGKRIWRAWLTNGYFKSYERACIEAESPEEAVAKLWLKLNQNPSKKM